MNPEPFNHVSPLLHYKSSIWGNAISPMAGVNRLGSETSDLQTTLVQTNLSKKNTCPGLDRFGLR